MWPLNFRAHLRCAPGNDRSLGVHFMGHAPYGRVLPYGRALLGVCTIGVDLMGVHFMGMHSTGGYLMGVQF